MTTEKAIEFGKIFLKTIENEKGSATYEFVETAVKMMEQEPCEDAIIIPKGATNGDMIKAVFPNIDASVSGEGDVIDVYELGIYCQTFDSDWWKAPYERG
jgi:hypothetical protein